MYNHHRRDTPELRDNAIIEITAHGRINLDEKIQVPEGMNVIIIGAAAPGVVNYLDKELLPVNHKIIDMNLEGINQCLNSLTRNMSEDTINNVKSFFSWISGELQNIDAIMYNTFRYDLPSDSYGSFEHMRKKGYLNTFDKSYSFKIYKSGEQILNKTFSRRDDEITELYPFKINMLSKDENDKDANEDLMAEIVRHTPDGSTPLHVSTATLEELLNYLKSEEIKNVVIFDFSCSRFMRNDKFITNQREIRSIRRGILNERQQPENNRTRNRRLTDDTRGGKRFTRKNRKSRKPFRKSKKSKKSKKSRKNKK